MDQIRQICYCNTHLVLITKLKGALGGRSLLVWNGYRSLVSLLRRATPDTWVFISTLAYTLYISSPLSIYVRRGNGIRNFPFQPATDLVSSSSSCIKLMHGMDPYFLCSSLSNQSKPRTRAQAPNLIMTPLLNLRGASMQVTRNG